MPGCQLPNWCTRAVARMCQRVPLASEAAKHLHHIAVVYTAVVSFVFTYVVTLSIGTCFSPIRPVCLLKPSSMHCQIEIVLALSKVTQIRNRSIAFTAPTNGPDGRYISGRLGANYPTSIRRDPPCRRNHPSPRTRALPPICRFLPHTGAHSIVEERGAWGTR